MPVAQVNLVVLSGSADDPRGQVRRRQPDGGDARRGRGLAVVARDRRRGRLPRRRPRRREQRSIRRRSGCTCRWRGSPTRCRSWPTSRCGRRFPRDELERLRQQRLTALLQARDDPATIAALAFAAGAVRHRRTASAPPRWARPTTIKAFTVDDLRAFYASRSGRTTRTLLVVGDVTPDR